MLNTSVSRLNIQPLLRGLLALLAGLLVARLPLLWAVIGLVTAAAIIGTLIDPLIGLGITLLLGPTKPLTDYFVPQLPIDLGQIALMITLGAWFIHAARRKKIILPRSPFSVPVLLFIGAALLSLLDALSLGFALKEFIKWGQFLFVIWLVIDLAGQPERQRWPVVIGFVLLAALLEALTGIWQFGLRGDGPEHFLILDDRFYRAYGTFEQPNPYAGFIGMTLALAVGLALGALERWFEPVWSAWKTRQRPLQARPFIEAAINSGLPALLGFAALCGILLSGLIMSWSRGAWMGFGAAALAIVFTWPRKTWVGFALVSGGLFIGWAGLEFNLLPASIADRLLGFTDFLQTFDVRGVDINSANFSVMERLAHWQTAQEMARYNPWLGVGLGNYEPVYPGYALLNWRQALGHAHNIYLNMLAEVGIIGLVAYVVMWGAILWQTWAFTRHDDAPVWSRAVALGLIGTWTHISVHQFLDKLFVANLHLHMGALLGVLSIIILTAHGEKASDG